MKAKLTAWIRARWPTIQPGQTAVTNADSTTIMLLTNGVPYRWIPGPSNTVRQIIRTDGAWSTNLHVTADASVIVNPADSGPTNNPTTKEGALP